MNHLHHVKQRSRSMIDRIGHVKIKMDMRRTHCAGTLAPPHGFPRERVCVGGGGSKGREDEVEESRENRKRRYRVESEEGSEEKR